MFSRLILVIVILSPLSHLRAAHFVCFGEKTCRGLASFYAHFPEGEVQVDEHANIRIGNTHNFDQTALYIAKTLPVALTFLSSCQLRNLTWLELGLGDKTDRESIARLLTQQTALKRLSIGSKHGDSSLFLPTITNVVSAHKDISELEVHIRTLNDEVAQQIKEGLKNNKSLTSLTLQSNVLNLSLSGEDNLLSFIRQHPYLTELKSHEGFDAFPTLAIKTALEVNKAYRETRYAGTVLWSAVQQKKELLASMKMGRRNAAPQTSQLEPLWQALVTQRLTEDYLERIVSFLTGDRTNSCTPRIIKANPAAWSGEEEGSGQNKHLKNYIAILQACGLWNKREYQSLGLAIPPLTTTKFEEVRTIISAYELDLTNCTLDKSSLQFMPLLNKNPCITRLDISQAKVNPLFYTYLKKNKTIQTLIALEFSKKNDLSLLVDAVAHNKSLECLALSEEQLTVPLLKAIKKHPRLTSFQWLNSSSEITKQQVHLLLGPGSKLQHLNLGDRKLSSKEVALLLEIMQHNYTFLQLDHGTAINYLTRDHTYLDPVFTDAEGNTMLLSYRTYRFIPLEQSEKALASAAILNLSALNARNQNNQEIKDEEPALYYRTIAPRIFLNKRCHELKVFIEKMRKIFCGMPASS